VHSEVANLSIPEWVKGISSNKEEEFLGQEMVMVLPAEGFFLMHKFTIREGFPCSSTIPEVNEVPNSMSAVMAYFLS
jgi:hypothetical protein